MRLEPEEIKAVATALAPELLAFLASVEPAKAAGPILVGKQAAADLLDVSQATVDRLRKAGLPHIKLDGRILFRPESLREWAESQETTANGEGVGE